MTLVATIRHEGQLMLHEELLALEQEYPQHFRYQPVLTRSWPTAWGYLKGRILRVVHSVGGKDQIDISPFKTIVPDIAHSHLRICGGVTACRQLTLGLEQDGLVPLTVRAESW